METQRTYDRRGGFRQIMVKEPIWRRLNMVAIRVQLETGEPVGRGEVIARMLDTLYPHIQPTDAQLPE